MAATTSDSAAEDSPPELSADLSTILDALPVPTYALDDENTVVEWGSGLETLLGLSADEMIGTDEYFGRDADGNRIKTLANRVVEDPHGADTHEGTDRVESEYTDSEVYESALWLENDAGERRFIRFQAMPIFEDGEFEGVVQLCQDETDQKRRQEATEALVEAVIETLEAISDGNLSARVSFERTAYVEDELLAVLDQVNQTADRLEGAVESVAGVATSESAATGGICCC